MMNRFFTLLLAASCLTAVGQVTYPYNPDGNADTLIGITDLQDLLVVYGNPFLPSEIQVGDSSLTFWVDQVSNSLDQLNQNLANGQLTRTRSWPLGQHGRVINHIFQDGDFFVPADSALFITHGNSLIVTTGANTVGLTDLNNNNTNHRPLPIPSGATLSAYGIDYWFSGVLIANHENIEILLWDFSDGPYTVPEGKIFIPRWTDGNWGGLITGFFDYNLPSSVVGDRFIELTFPEGTTLVDNNDAGEMVGYLLDKDYFATPETFVSGVAEATQEVQEVYFTLDGEYIEIQPTQTIVLYSGQCGTTNSGGGVNCTNLNLLLGNDFYEGEFSDFEEVKIFNAGTVFSNDPVFYDQEVRFSLYGQEYGVLPNRYVALVHFQGEWFVEDDGLIGDD